MRMMMSGHTATGLARFQSEKFEPRKIILQILCLQSAYYSLLLLWFLIVCTLFGWNPSYEETATAITKAITVENSTDSFILHMVNTSLSTFTNTSIPKGLPTANQKTPMVISYFDLLWDGHILSLNGVAPALHAMAFIFIAFPMAYIVSSIVKRTKKCLDFCFTLYFVHFILTSLCQKECPHRLLWWVLQLLGLTWMVLWSEKLCLIHEMEPIIISASSGLLTKKESVKAPAALLRLRGFIGSTFSKCMLKLRNFQSTLVWPFTGLRKWMIERRRESNAMYQKVPTPGSSTVQLQPMNVVDKPGSLV